MCSNVSEFIKNNPSLDIVKKVINADEKKDYITYSCCFAEINQHLIAVEQIRNSKNKWDNCNCDECNIWKNHLENSVIIGAR